MQGMGKVMVQVALWILLGMVLGSTSGSPCLCLSGVVLKWESWALLETLYIRTAIEMRPSNPLHGLTRMPPKTIEEAEWILQKSAVLKTSFNPFSKDTLRLLCNKYALEFSRTGKRQAGVPIKLDYIGALLSEVEVSLYRAYIINNFGSSQLPRERT
jgi:hypothetical protein